MYDWLPIAVAIVAVAAVSGAIRRRVAPLRGERRPSKKGGMFESIASTVLFVVFMMVVLVIIAAMTKR